MKLFSWMHSKLNAKQQGTFKTSAAPPPHPLSVKKEPPEESSDWPSGLLTIGTLGNAGLIEQAQQESDAPECPPSPDDLSDFTPEEVGKLQKELTKLLSRKPATSKAQQEIADLPLDRFLNCPSSLEVDRRISSSSSHSMDAEGGGDNDDLDIERTICVIIRKCREICEDRNKKKQAVIGKRSMSFLLKKMFVCRSGFDPVPSLRDTLQESRMEKLLRTLLQKKIYPRSTSRAPSVKRYLENKINLKGWKKDNDDDDNDGDYREHERTDDKGKWVKTDSEYIVLEI
ncbi:hypothetical protein SAY86_031292 [Trapa natans]|uniref:Uncharacterized protein n=1 Tax=Trapa natans TaxID=22666 RepID=A0AAN7R3E8_TRANT|nr:hypothetical protein SAY86_031292 [Trapa natans]